MANTERVRLVRCPKCLNVLPEPADVIVYKCGGCGTTLRAKIRANNGQHVSTKQVRQDSDNFSVATIESSGAPQQNKDQALSGAAMDSSSIADAPSTELDSNGIRSNDNGDAMLIEKNATEVENTENKHSVNFEGQDASSGMGTPADLTHPNANGAYSDSGAAENHTVEQSAKNSDICRVIEDNTDAERRLDASESENKMPSDEMSKASVSMQDFEQKGAEETEHAASKKSYLVRVQSRSCDLRASMNSIDFHSVRTSLQSKSFRASEPLQSKIMNSVDELKDDLSELFSSTRPYPPGPRKQNGHMVRAGAITTSAPLAAYHPAAKHSGYASRPSRSGQVPRLPPRGLPSPRYRRHRAFSYHHSMQMPMEMRPCRYECCHSCRPPCYRSCQQEPVAMPKPPPVKEIKRRPPPRHHCRPVLGGAPFVICSSCLQLVQLPTDFAVPSRGTRRLQCGACSAVLSYSYRDPGRRKKPRSPFGGDEYSVDGSEFLHRADDAEQADPVSYSEEYGLSFGVSHSTSTEDGRPLYVSRNSSFNTVDEGMGRDGKLHRLMGYSSASELLRRRHSPDLYESFDGRPPAPPPGNAGTHVDRKGKGVCVDDGGGAGVRDGPVKRPKARSGVLPFQGILKKGIHSLESLKLRP